MEVKTGQVRGQKMRSRTMQCICHLGPIVPNLDIAGSRSEQTKRTQSCQYGRMRGERPLEIERNEPNSANMADNGRVGRQSGIRRLSEPVGEPRP